VREPWSGPTPIQIVILAALAIIAIVVIIVGVRIVRREFGRRRAGEHIPGFGLGVLFGGVSLALLTGDLGIRTFTGIQERNIFGLWFFLPAPQLGDWIYGFFATPALDFLVIAVFIAFIGLPSLTQLRS
jgi:hypothetical protein